jgi:hypothetical protein
MTKRTIARIYLLLALAITPAASFAGVITYDFTFDAPWSSLPEKTASGYFTIDDSLATPGSHSGGSFTDFAVNWVGRAYDESLAEIGWLTFDNAGNLTNWAFGSNCYPNTCISGGNSYDWTAVINQAVSGGLTGTLYYGTGVVNHDGSGIVTLARRVPEPSTMALMFGALLCVPLLARRRRSIR